MRVQISEMGVKLRKFAIFTFRRSYRLICNHPFLVGMLLFLIFLHRSSPFVFSLLVTASPILVCTAVLLGTLLSFGQPHIPEIQRGEKFINEIGSLRTGVSRDTVVVEKSEGCSVERVTHRSGEIVEHVNRDLDLGRDTSGDLFRGDTLDSSSPLVEERSGEIKLEKEEGEGMRLLHELENTQKNEIYDERLVDRQAKVEDEELELDNDKSPADSFDSERVNVDSLDSPPGSPWKHVEEEELVKGDAEEDAEDTESDQAAWKHVEEEELVKGDAEEDAEDTESDQAESSSPDASMADIIPLLDELHPLLDEDAPQPDSLSHYGSDAASDHSEKSGDISSESEDDVEKHEEFQGADEEDEDADDEEEEPSNKESQTKAAITWTEEDQRNLMDLGSSELERNQRLESLMARRRARKTMSMMPERNLIDLETVDLPHNVAPIVTSRNNPFDSTHDAYDSMGLPPIPGSAPSILLPRRNPFDIPYDSSEEKPDLLGDSFQQEFSSFPSKEPLFRRRESFNVGPSIFGPSRQEKQDISFRPLFVPERSDLEESSYSPFQRQSSGLSESKTSSVPETESVVSNADIEEINLMGEATQNAGTLNFVPEIELRTSASYLEPRNFLGGDFSQEPEPLMKSDNDNLNEEDFSQETEVIVKIEDVSEQVGHGSQSSEEEDSSSEVSDVEERELKVDKVDGQLVNYNNHQVENLTVEERGVSSLLELHDGVQMQGQFFQQGSDANKESGSVGDVEHKEPIYDSSPTSMRKDLSSSSALSELHIESETGSPSVLVKGTVSFAERESELGMHALEGTSATKETPPGSCPNHLPTEHQSEASTVTNLIEIDVLPTDKGSNVTIAAELPLATSVQGNSMNQLRKHGSTDKHISSAFDSKVDGTPQQNVESLASSSEDKSANYPKEQLHCEEIPHRKSTDNHSTVSLDKRAFQTETSKAPSPSSGEIDDAVSVKSDEKQIYLNGQHALEDKSLSDLHEELVFLDRTMDETSSSYQHGLQESLVMPEEISEELSPRESSNVSYIQDLETVPANINSPTSPESINIPSEAYESGAVEGYSDDEFENYNLFQSTKGKTISAENSSMQGEMERRDYIEDLIKGSGEDLLSELDTVGDFSVWNLNSGSDVFGTHSASDKATEKIVLAMQDQIEAKSRVQNSNIDVNSKMPVFEVQSKQDLEAIFKKAESTSSNELHSSDMPSESKATQKNSTEIPIVEARNIVDVDLKDVQKDDNGKFTETKMQLQNAVEAGSAKDTNLNKHHHAEDSVKPTIPASVLDGYMVKSVLIQKPVPASGKDSEKNEAATTNDQKSSMKEFSVHGSKNNADVNSDAKVTVSEMSRDESKGKESILSSGRDSEKTESATPKDQQFSTKKSAVEGSRSYADVSSGATVAPSEISVVSYDDGKGKDTVLASGKDSKKSVESDANDQQSSMKESTVEASPKNGGVSSNAKVAESEISAVSHDEGKVKEPVMASGKDSGKNEAGAFNDQKSNAKGSTVKGSECSAGVSSEAKVASSECSVVSHYGGNTKDSVLASIKDSEKSVAGAANDQQLRAKDSTVKGSESGAGVSSKAKVAPSDSSVMSHDGGKVKESILTSVKDSEKNVAGAANDQQLHAKDSTVKGTENSFDVNSGAKVAASESSVVSHDGEKVKESVLASGKDSEKSEAGTANDRQLLVKECDVKGSESSDGVSSEAKVAASESSVVLRDGEAR